MKLEEARLFRLAIPFRLRFDHARAERLQSDSIVLRLRSGGYSGYGEAVVREYVTGALGTEENPLGRAAEIAASILLPLLDGDLDRESLIPLSRRALRREEYPVSCAVETALLDLLCNIGNTDVYDLLETPPLRRTVRYGGILPLASAPLAERILSLYAGLGLKNLRVKLGRDGEYNRRILGICRARLGPGFDIRVDVNGAWDRDTWEEGLSVCGSHGVSMIEQPFYGPWSDHLEDLRRASKDGFRFAADESAVDEADLTELSGGFCRLVNLRLSKNGGLLRTLAMAAKAEKLGMGYQLGCHVGETGVLSALGRAAGALLPNPEYVDGSYDPLLLLDNITTEHFGFGKNGEATVPRGIGTGCNVDPEKLERLSTAQINCL